jgi:endonuclease YncB( thermonuclease family)
MFKKTDLKVEIGAGIALILLTGCTSKPASFSNTVAQTPALEIITPRTDSPRSLKLKLTLGSPTDLKVQQNDWVTKGQIIGDRTSERTRLGQEKQRLVIKLDGLKSMSTQQSYAVEETKVEEARKLVVQTWDELERFKSSSPWTEYAKNRLPLTQEETQFAALKAKHQLAKSGLAAARAELEAAKQQKASRQDTSAQQAQVLGQIHGMDEKISQLGTVRAPYEGTIKLVKWLGQNDQQLQVEVSLAVNSSRPATTAQFPVSSPSMSLAVVPNSQPAAVERVEGIQSARQSGGFTAEWRVLSVHDGDTIRVSQGQKTERIRFACIDAPELKQPMGVQSRDFLRQLIAAGSDRVSLKVVDTDRYGRKVAEVFTNGKLVQAEQVKSGMVYVYEKYLSNCPNAGMVQQAQTIAQQQRVGVWSGNYEKPWEYRHHRR